MMNFRKFYENIQPKINVLVRNKHFNTGAPVLCFIILGVAVLSVSQNIRFKFKPVKSLTKEECHKMGFKHPSEFSLEEECEKMQKLAQDDYDMIRIPRPWEKSPQTAK